MQGRLSDTNLLRLTTISVPQGGDEGQKNRIINNAKFETAAMSGFPANIFLTILVIVFVGAGKCTFRSNFPDASQHALH